MNNNAPVGKSRSACPRIMQRLWSLAAALLLAIGLYSSGCGDRPAKPTTSNAKITVASLVPAATDVIVHMGAADHLVAISNWDAKLPGLEDLPRVGDYRTVDWEKLAEIKPTVMIVQFAPEKMPGGLQDRAHQLGIRLVNVRINRLEEIFTTITQIGQAIDELEKARLAAEMLRADLDAVRARVASRPPVRTLLIRSESDLASVGGGNFMDDLLTLAGGKNVLEQGENSYPTIDREQLLMLDPDVVILLLPGESEHVIERARRFWAGMSSITAVKNGRVHVLTDSYLLLPGMSAGKIASKLADLLHPAGDARSRIDTNRQISSQSLGKPAISFARPDLHYPVLPLQALAGVS